MKNAEKKIHFMHKTAKFQSKSNFAFHTFIAYKSTPLSFTKVHLEKKK